jgi:hypothetical protein
MTDHDYERERYLRDDPTTPITPVPGLRSQAGDVNPVNDMDDDELIDEVTRMRHEMREILTIVGLGVAFVIIIAVGVIVVGLLQAWLT